MTDDIVPWDECCGNKMSLYNCELTCMKCGLITQFSDQGSSYTESSAGGHNTPYSANSVGLTSSGHNSSYIKRLLYQKLSSDYNQIKRYKTLNQLRLLNSNSNNRLPDIVIETALDYFSSYQDDKNIVKRGNGRLAVLSIFLSYACAKFDIAIKPKQLALWANVSQRHISKESDTINNYMNSIGISSHIDTKSSFINKYFEIFMIDEKFKAVAMEIIDISYSRKMISPENPNISTKVVAVIYLLKKRLNLTFTEKEMAKECFISMSTFVKYYKNLVRNYKLMNPILEVYGIPPIIKPKSRIKKPV